MNPKLFNTIICSAIVSSLFSTVLPGKALSNEVTGRTRITVTIEAPSIQDTQLANSNEYYVVDFEDQDGTGAFSKTANNTTYAFLKIRTEQVLLVKQLITLPMPIVTI